MAVATDGNLIAQVDSDLSGDERHRWRGLLARRLHQAGQDQLAFAMCSGPDATRRARLHWVGEIVAQRALCDAVIRTASHGDTVRRARCSRSPRITRSGHWADNVPVIVRRRTRCSPAAPGTRLWIVMYPFEARRDFSVLEPAIAEIFARSFRDAPGVIAGELQAVRPRLVFGQYALAEAVRSARDALDPPVLECAKLLAYERSLSQLFALGPTELVYEQRAPAGPLVFGVRTLTSGERVGELRITNAILDESARLHAAFETSHPELFARPYVSAARYLLRAM